MEKERRELVERHIRTHTEHSVADRAAVDTLKFFLRSGGKINATFSSDDKWPNHDGFFEFVSNPEISKRPEMVFDVQIKGTHKYTEKDDVISYSLESLAFPAFIANNVTSNPGILFVVLNPDIRGAERVFWKYMSPAFLNSIDFEKNSSTIKFSKGEEIVATDEGIDDFCKRIEGIVDTHFFLNNLDKNSISKEDALKIVAYRDKEISGDIEFLSENPEMRDHVSKRIVRGLHELCYSVIILNAIKKGYKEVNEPLAWEVAMFDAETKYLSDFLKGIKYVGMRIPEEGQSERLMLKYYNYLWEVRKLLKKDYSISVLENLEKFPLNLDKLDEDYYRLVAESIEKVGLTPWNVRVSRYYVQKKTPFFVNKERYFEITLQLAGLYSTKYNRITVYSKENIDTDYSIQIAYLETDIELWGVKNSIKLLNNWKVSIAPQCLNKLAKMLKVSASINRNYGEYENLMACLTKTNLNLLDIINLSEARYQSVYRFIYGKTNTHIFGDILDKLRNEYSYKSDRRAATYTVRYALLNMKDESLESFLPNPYFNDSLSEDVYITRKCIPFEKNPMISNLAGRKTSKNEIRNIAEVVNDRGIIDIATPYVLIEKEISETGELFFYDSFIKNLQEVEIYNRSLDAWERKNGYLINHKDGLLSIDSYDNTTIYILKKLLEWSRTPGDRGNEQFNKRYINICGITFEDQLKKIALEKLFVNSRVLLVYGAAGTGKTTLLNYIANMRRDLSQLFLAKTHAAIQNMSRRIDNEKAVFKSIDSVVRAKKEIDYDIIFVDECSTIDNRTMRRLLEKIPTTTRIVLAGDIYQIESIEFGNWFYYAKDIIKTNGAVIELRNNWRTDSAALKSLWDEVRAKKEIIIEKLSMDGPFSENLGENIFHQEDEDEVVLCLNYDGKFGLNNMNQYFQNANDAGNAISWAEWTFKKGDKILFLESKRFPMLYNNLKGKILEIDKNGNASIHFMIEVYASFSKAQCEDEGIIFIRNTDNGTIIRFDVIAWDDELSEIDKAKTVIPFQLAYAVSIHKAQGLEYNSVKVIIPSSNAERISHSIFYTAITRAKYKLKIFWSPETMESIIKSITEEKGDHITLPIIKRELGI